MFDNKIKFFIDTVETGSFSACARLHYVSQSAVSQSITKLEKEMNVKLFNRQGYKPVLTEAGHYYYKELAKIKEKHDAIILNTRQLAKTQDRIIFGISNGYEKRHILNILSSFKKEHDIAIEIKHHNPIDGADLLKRHLIDIDFGILNSYDGQAGLASVPIYASTPCVILSNQHPLAQESQISVERLSHEPVVVLKEIISKKTYDYFLNAFRLDGYSPKIVKECNNTEDFFMAVRLGEGIGYTVKELVHNEEGIVAIPIKNTHHRSVMVIAYPKETKNETILSLIQAIKAYFKTL